MVVVIPGFVDSVLLGVLLMLTLPEILLPLLFFFAVTGLGVRIGLGVAVGRTLLRPMVGVVVITHVEAPSGIRA